MTSTAPEIGLQLASAWVNVGDASTYGTYSRDPIVITRGRSNWAGSVDPGRATFTLDSRSHNWAPDDVRSTFWRSYARNIPCRIGVPSGSPYLRYTGASADVASCADAVALHITGDLELQVAFQLEETPLDIAAGYTYKRLIHKNGAGDGFELELYNAGGRLAAVLIWTDAGGVEHQIASDGALASFPYWMGYQPAAIKATLDVDNGAAGHTVTFYYSTSLAGSWTQLSQVITAGVTTIKSSTAALKVGGTTTDDPTVDVPFPGRITGVKVLSGIAGSVVANADFTAQAVGATSFTDGAGRSWAIGAGGRLTNVQWRFHGELASLPVRSDLKGSDVWAPVEATGILRRLRQGQPVLESALRRAMTRKATNLIGYWPCEESGRTLTAFGAVVGNVPMNVTGGYPTTATNTDFTCSSALPTPGATVWAATPDLVATTEWQVRWLQSIPAAAAGADYNVIDIGSVGTHAWYVHWQAAGGGNMRLIAALNTTGATVYDSGWIAFNASGKPLRMTVGVKQNGGNIDVQMYGTPVGGVPAGFATGAAVAGTVGAVNVVRVNSTAGMTGTAFGHITLQTKVTDYNEMGTELSAYSGELAAARVARLCVEEGIKYRIEGDPARSEAMGPQTPQTLVDLLQECADADLGILAEARDSLALWYRCRDDVVGQVPALTLNYTGGEVAGIVELDRDDQGFYNDWTVKGPTGATGRSELNDGSRISTAQPPTGAGRYATSANVNALENRVPHLARTRLRFTAVDEPRVSRLGTGLYLPAISGSSSQTAAVLNQDLGDLVNVTNLGNYTGTLSQIVQGTRETIAHTRHALEYLTTSGRPWGTGILNDTTYPARADTAGSTLSASAIAGATILLVASVASPLWTITAGDWPFDIDVNGVRVTVTNVAGATSPQTFTVTAIARALPSGARVQLADPTYVEL